MTAAIIIPIAIWQARRDRQAALKREQELIEAMEALSDAELAADPRWRLKAEFVDEASQ